MGPWRPDQQTDRTIQSQINSRLIHIIISGRFVVTRSIYFGIETTLRYKNFRCTPRCKIYVLWFEGFFLETPMSRADYMRIYSKYPPQEIISLYHIDGLIAEDGYLYIKTIKSMYGLKQASIISFNHIEPGMFQD